MPLGRGFGSFDFGAAQTGMASQDPQAFTQSSPGPMRDMMYRFDRDRPSPTQNPPDARYLTQNPLDAPSNWQVQVPSPTQNPPAAGNGMVGQDGAGGAFMTNIPAPVGMESPNPGNEGFMVSPNPQDFTQSSPPPAGGSLSTGGRSPSSGTPPVAGTPAEQAPPFSGMPRWGSPLNRDAPYPVRQFAPQSGVVNNPLAGMDTMADWEADWQNRYNRTPATITSTSTTRAPGTWENMNTFEGGPQAFFAARNAADDGQWRSAQSGNQILTEVYVPGEDQTQSTSRANPAYQALLDERNQFEPLWQNQQRQQQAFNMMEGQGQRFGMMGPDYTNPGFGQVSGEVNPFSPDMGAGRAAIQGANDGISTDWLTGVYDPAQMQATGVYRPGGLGGLGGMR